MARRVQVQVPQKKKNMNGSPLWQHMRPMAFLVDGSERILVLNQQQRCYTSLSEVGKRVARTQGSCPANQETEGPFADGCGLQQDQQNQCE